MLLRRMSEHRIVLIVTLQELYCVSFLTITDLSIIRWIVSMRLSIMLVNAYCDWLDFNMASDSDKKTYKYDLWSKRISSSQKCFWPTPFSWKWSFIISKHCDRYGDRHQHWIGKGGYCAHGHYRPSLTIDVCSFLSNPLLLQSKQPDLHYSGIYLQSIF